MEADGFVLGSFQNFIPRLFILGSYFKVCFFGKRTIKALECSQFLVGKFPSWGWSGAINYQAYGRIDYSHSGHCPRHTRKTQKFRTYRLQWDASAHLNHEGSAHHTHMQTHTQTQTPPMQTHTHKHRHHTHADTHTTHATIQTHTHTHVPWASLGWVSRQTNPRAGKQLNLFLVFHAQWKWPVPDICSGHQFWAETTLGLPVLPDNFEIV